MITKKDNKGIGWTITLGILFLVLLSGILLCIRYCIKQGISTAKDSFLNTYMDSKKDMYDEFYNYAFQYAEQANHVSNRVDITFNNIKEKSLLEVLQVGDVVYIIEDGKEAGTGTTSWLKVTGMGTFTVDMMAAEYIVDNPRSYVLVRVPKPVLDYDNIHIESAESIFFSENKWRLDNSVKKGEELALNQLSEAKSKIQTDFCYNEHYFKLASSSAKNMLVGLLKGMNPDIPELTVEVEFY